MEHAFLEVREPPRGGGSTPGGVREQIAFQFNPKQMQFSKSASWVRQTQVNSASSSVPEFRGSEPVQLVLEMFLDATESMDASVVNVVERLFSLVVPTKETLAELKGRPPVVIFRWGGLNGFVAFVTDVNVTYSLFTAGGTPIRAIARVTLNEMTPEYPAQNPTSGSERPRATHRVVVGDSLASLAYREYGDARRWRGLAHANNIDEPATLRPGDTLMLPAADDLEQEMSRG